MTILLRFWPHVLVAALIIGAGVYINRLGYESGYNASEAKWQPAFAAASKARDEANARARTLETASTQLSAQTEKEYADTIASLNLRAADSERRIFGLVRQLAQRPDSSAVPKDGPATRSADAAAEVERRVAEAGGSISDVGRGCEADAAQVEAWQQWARGQMALFYPATQ